MRKQVGQIDADLLARVDALASQRGQTRRVVVERALEAVLSEAKGAPSREQSGPAPVPSSESDGVRPAAQPRTHGDRELEARATLARREYLGTSPLVPTPDVAHGLRSNGHLQTCKCWRCEKLDGAGGPVPKLDGAA